MTTMMTRVLAFGAACCIAQAAGTAERLAFWTSGGEHGIDACVFTSMFSVEHLTGSGGGLQVGVAAGKTLQLVGTVKLRHDAATPAPRLLQLGAGADTLLSVPLKPAKKNTVKGTMPAGPAKELMGSLLHREGLWLRIDGAAPKPVEVGGTDEQVTSCIATLERDLADERDARTRGELTTSFPFLEDDD